MPGRIVASTLLCMIGLAVVGPVLSAENGFDGVYTGKQVLTKGSDQACLAGNDVSVTIHGQTVTFTNGSLRDVTIGFDPHRDGSFSQISVGVETDTVFIKGRVVGGDIEADVATRECEHHWHLKRTGPP